MTNPWNWLRRRRGTPPLPPVELRFMGENAEEFLAIGDSIVDQLEHWASLSIRKRILDMGCGYGRLAHALQRAGYDGHYLGLDVLGRHILWCQRHLSGRRWRFRHIDVRNSRYNPRGKLEARGLTLARHCRRADLIVASSLFTHLDAATVRHYLSQFAAVLEPQGVIYSTFFCLTPRHQEVLEEGSATVMSFAHDFVGGGRYEYADEPLRAVGYDEVWLHELFGSLGLEIRHASTGSWCSSEVRAPYQDVYVLGRRDEGDRTG